MPTGKSRLLIAILVLLAAPAAPVLPRTDASALCTRAASDAAARTGVPYDVLLAISLVETGRDDRPWPWTVNAGGDGRWFDSVEAAAAHVESVLQEGRTNVDLGCFQLNYRWHAAAFGSIAEMLDPDLNAGYAAEYLARHFARTGNWADAAAAYHSATPEHAETYRARFERVLAQLTGGGAAMPSTDPVPEAERENRFPLLVAGSSGRNGSLVPATGGGIRLIGAP